MWPQALYYVSRVRTLALTSAALVGFASNSLLTRAALATHELDPATFTLVRVLAGAVTIVVLVALRGRPATERGSWSSAAALAGYAIFFTLAYNRINASVGALVLFGAVQTTMMSVGLVRGERLGAIDWIGVALAIAGLLVFAVPGVTAPDPLGTAMMAIGGACWGVYSLAGQRARDPLAETAGNFIRALIPIAVFAAVSLPSRHVTTPGVLLAVVSGSLASGVAYTIWYAVLPAVAAWRAAIVQTGTPLLTAIAAIVFLDETFTVRLLIASALVITGVLLTVLPALHRRLVS